jgi:hypothetical protein
MAQTSQGIPNNGQTAHYQISYDTCLGDIQGARWLDGRTTNGTVGLASTTESPFTGTKWEARMYSVTIDENQ